MSDCAQTVLPAYPLVPIHIDRNQLVAHSLRWIDEHFDLVSYPWLWPASSYGQLKGFNWNGKCIPGFLAAPFESVPFFALPPSPSLWSLATCKPFELMWMLRFPFVFSPRCFQLLLPEVFNSSPLAAETLGCREWGWRQPVLASITVAFISIVKTEKAEKTDKCGLFAGGVRAPVAAKFCRLTCLFETLQLKWVLDWIPRSFSVQVLQGTKSMRFLRPQTQRVDWAAHCSIAPVNLKPAASNCEVLLHCTTRPKQGVKASLNCCWQRLLILYCEIQTVAGWVLSEATNMLQLESTGASFSMVVYQCGVASSIIKSY